MYNSYKRSINWEEFNDLKKIVDQCITFALRDSELELNRTKVFRDAKSSQKIIDQLMECYKRSQFGNDASTEYLEFIRKQVDDILGEKIIPKFSDPNRMRIMIPVAFYSLIIQNESNNKTVTRRRNKVYNASSGKHPDVSWHKRNPYMRHWDMYLEQDLTEMQRFTKIVQSGYAKAQQSHFFESNYIADQLKAAEHRLVNMCEYLRFVHYCSDVAAAGDFLLDILSTTYNEKYPLDTIIMMGCILRLGELFTGTRLLIAGHRENWGRRRNGQRRNIKRNFAVINLLDEYMIDKYGYDFHKEHNAVIPIFYTGREEIPQTKIIYEDDKSRLKDRFDLYYTHIRKNYEFDIEDIVSCFLDSSVFIKFISMDSSIVQDAKAIQKIIHILPELQAANEAAERIIRVSDLFENNRTFLSKKFDYYEWMDKDKMVGDVHDLEDSFRIQQHEAQHMMKQQERARSHRQLELDVMNYIVANGFTEGDLPNGYKITLNMDFEHIDE